MGIVVGPNPYGKAENRVVRIVRDTARHQVERSETINQLTQIALLRFREVMS